MFSTEFSTEFSTDTKINVFWFRRDLRLKDNTGLGHALRQGRPVLPVFIFDTHILDLLEDKSDARVQFIHESLKKINEELSKGGSSLLALHNTPANAFKKILSEFNIQAVFANRDYEPYALQRDQAVEQLLKENGVAFYTFKDHVVFEGREILNEQNQPYKVFTPYKNKWLSKFRPSEPELRVNVSAAGNFLRTGDRHFPSLAELGFMPSNIPVPGPVLDENLIFNYDKTRNYPGTKGTSRLGIHLRHGTLSIRTAAQKAAQLNDTWLTELIWREFYQMILFHFPRIVSLSFRPQYDHINWRNNEAEFQRWCEGTTGYPLVDAGMRELNATGFMHNRVRMITASFLTKHLLIDWRWGEAYFAKKLLDYELASNNGGWQWAAGTGTDAQPYFRVFSPDLQVEKFDKEKNYLRKWVPEFESKNYPKPIVDHKFARQRAIDTYKAALS